MTKADASRAVDALFSPSEGIIATALRGDRRVQITGFGTFEAKHRKARMGRNPFSGEMQMFKAKPASKTVRIRALKGLRDMIK